MGFLQLTDLSGNLVGSRITLSYYANYAIALSSTKAYISGNTLSPAAANLYLTDLSGNLTSTTTLFNSASSAGYAIATPSSSLTPAQALLRASNYSNIKITKGVSSN